MSNQVPSEADGQQKATDYNYEALAKSQQNANPRASEANAHLTWTPKQGHIYNEGGHSHLCGCRGIAKATSEEAAEPIGFEYDLLNLFDEFAVKAGQPTVHGTREEAMKKFTDAILAAHRRDIRHELQALANSSNWRVQLEDRLEQLQSEPPEGEGE